MATTPAARTASRRPAALATPRTQPCRAATNRAAGTASSAPLRATRRGRAFRAAQGYLLKSLDFLTWVRFARGPPAQRAVTGPLKSLGFFQVRIAGRGRRSGRAGRYEIGPDDPFTFYD